MCKFPLAGDQNCKHPESEVVQIQTTVSQILRSEVLDTAIRCIFWLPDIKPSVLCHLFRRKERLKSCSKKRRVQLVKATVHWIIRMIHRESLEQQETVRLHLNLTRREINWNCGWKKALDNRETLLNTCILNLNCSRFRNYKLRKIVQLFMKIIMNTKLHTHEGIQVEEDRIFGI